MVVDYRPGHGSFDCNDTANILPRKSTSLKLEKVDSQNKRGVIMINSIYIVNFEC